MSKNKKSRTHKKANWHSAILAVIISVMFFTLVNPEACRYEEIVGHRNQVIAMVGTTTINEEDIMAGHEQCIREMDELENTSRLGEFLVKCDQNNGGRIINWFIVYGMRCLVLYLSVHIIIQLVRGVAYLAKDTKVKGSNDNPQQEDQ